MQRVEEELHADEAQDDAQAIRQVDQTLQEAINQKNIWRRPIKANALVVKTRNGSEVMP